MSVCVQRPRLSPVLSCPGAGYTFPFPVLIVFYECLPVFSLLYIEVCAVNCTWRSDAAHGEDLVFDVPGQEWTVCTASVDLHYRKQGDGTQM